MRRTLLFTSISAYLIYSFLLIDNSIALQKETKGIIFPGVKVDQYVIGEPYPEKQLCKDTDNLNISCDDSNTIKRIRTTSSDYHISRSRIRVGDDIGNLFRYYGYGKTDFIDNRVVIKYPDLGIDFEINKYEETVKGIIIYKPSSPEFKIEQYKYYKEQMKK